MDSTQPARVPHASSSDRDGDPSDGWIIEAVAAGTLDALRDVARSARANKSLTPRDQAWCRALAEHLGNVDAAAMREVVAQLGAEPVTGNA